MGSLDFCGIRFRCLHREELFKEGEDTRFVITVNAEFIVQASRNRAFLNLINNNYATFDGQIPYAFARLVYPQQAIEKISGSDLIYDVCTHAQQHGQSLFLLGGDAEANRLAVANIRERYGIRVAGYAPPHQAYPFPPAHNQSILDHIQAFQPDFLFVAFGSVKQENWINDNLSFLRQQHVRLAVGCGGTFDFVSGRVKRAPRLLQKAGVEGVWRFLTEPRLFRLKRLLLSTHFFAVFYNHHIAPGWSHFRLP